MARRSRQGVLKRQRERKKAEKAAFKREQRAEKREQASEGAAAVASHDELAAYGLVSDPHDED